MGEQTEMGIQHADYMSIYTVGQEAEIELSLFSTTKPSRALHLCNDVAIGSVLASNDEPQVQEHIWLQLDYLRPPELPTFQ